MLATADLQRRRMRGQRFSTLARVAGVATIFVAMLLLGFLSLGAGVAVASWNYFTEDLPSIGEIEARQFETTKIYDRNGTLLYEVSDPEFGWRTYLSLDEITSSGGNNHIVNATIAAEDQTFWENYGVEPLAIVRGAFINVSGRGSSGGSTITQQLVRQLYPEKIGFDRSLDRKVREAIVAVQLTQTYSKEQILELYLNSIFYGNRSYGIDAASQAYFNKRPSELSLAEASMLAGLPQAPSYYDPTINMEAAKARQRYVLDQMVESGFITPVEADAAWEEILIPQSRENRYNLTPHWVNFVIDQLEARFGAEAVYRGGLQVRTTLDYDLQLAAQETVMSHLDTLRPYNVNNGTLVAILPSTGEIVAMIGSRDYDDESISGQVNVAVSERQPGSAFMPITYAAAFEKGWYPGTIILDYQTRYETPGAPEPEYVPQNTPNAFHGAVTAREALGMSLNIPAVKAIEFAGVENTIDLAHRIGIREGLWRGTGVYGLALTLGGGEVSPLELTNAYATFANSGRYVPYSAILEVAGPDGEILYSSNPETALARGRQVMEPGHAYEITSILSDDAARRPTYGAGNALEFPDLARPVAAKTGTSADFRDNWTVGYSTDLVVGVWVGNTDNAPMKAIDGVAGAAPIFHDFMVRAHDADLADALATPGGSSIDSAFARPDDIIEIDVCTATGKLPIDGESSYREVMTKRHKPAVRCDQLTQREADELRKALDDLIVNGDRYTEAGVESLLRYAEAVGGGVGIPDDPVEPTPTPSPTPTPTPTPVPASPTPTPVPRPPTPPPVATVTPTIPGNIPTPTPTPVAPGPTLVAVPSLFGLSEGAAADAIASVGLALGGISYVSQADLPPGIDITVVGVGQVILQSPAPGLQLPAGSPISIFVRAE